MKKRDDTGFRKCLRENGIKLRWDLDKKKSYLESCEFYRKYYDKLYGNYISKNKNINILEIGCSYGWFLHYLDKKGYRKIFGIDLDLEKISSINRFGVKKAQAVDAFEFLKNKRNYYDLVVITYVLEHIPKSQTKRFLNLIYKSLVIGGRIIVTTPNMESPLNLRIRYLDFTHEVAFTVSSLLHILYYSNFDNLKIRDTRIISGDENFNTRYQQAASSISNLCSSLGIHPPLFLGEGLICTGTKNSP